MHGYNMYAEVLARKPYTAGESRDVYLSPSRGVLRVHASLQGGRETANRNDLNLQHPRQAPTRPQTHTPSSTPTSSSHSPLLASAESAPTPDPSASSCSSSSSLLRRAAIRCQLITTSGSKSHTSPTPARMIRSAATSATPNGAGVVVHVRLPRRPFANDPSL